MELHELREHATANDAPRPAHIFVKGDQVRIINKVIRPSNWPKCWDIKTINTFGSPWCECFNKALFIHCWMLAFLVVALGLKSKYLLQHVVSRTLCILQKLEEICDVSLFNIMMQNHYCMVLPSSNAFHHGMKNWARYSQHIV
jgi:hypothetical protein